MKQILLISISIIAIWTCQSKSEKQADLNQSIYDRLEKVPDSIQVNEITVLNLFKNQILAHKNAQFDSLLIVEKVYKPHKALWDNCYGMIFGEGNAAKFNN